MFFRVLERGGRECSLGVTPPRLHVDRQRFVFPRRIHRWRGSRLMFVFEWERWGK